MAFPVVETVSSGTTAASTSHALTLPSGIASGDLLVAEFATTVSVTSIAWATGWTEIGEWYHASNYPQASVAYRVADGTEGSTVTVTIDSAKMAAFVIRRISGHNSTAPEVSTGAEGDSANPDPDSLTPSWGSKDTLWIAGEAVAGKDNTASAYPSGYTGGQTASATGGGPASQWCGIGSAYRTNAAASENPGTFTVSAEQWLAWTIGVEPGGGDTNVSANVETLTLTENAATITYDVNVNAAADTLTLTAHAATIDYAFNIDAATDALTLATHAATLTYDVDVQAAADALSLTPHSAAVTYDVDVPANADALTLATYAATIAYGVDVAASVDALTLTTHAASIAVDVNVAANVDALTVTTYPATFAADTNIAATTDALSLATHAAAITLDVNVQASADALVLAEYAATVAYEAAAQGAGLPRRTYSRSQVKHIDRIVREALERAKSKRRTVEQLREEATRAALNAATEAGVAITAEAVEALVGVHLEPYAARTASTKVKKPKPVRLPQSDGTLAPDFPTTPAYAELLAKLFPAAPAVDWAEDEDIAAILLLAA